MNELTEEQAVAITTLQGMIKTMIHLGLRPDVIQQYVDRAYVETPVDYINQAIETAPDASDNQEYEVPYPHMKNEPKESGTDETPDDGQ